MADNSYLGAFQIGGAISGLDIPSIIDKLMEIERRPLDRLQEKYDQLQLKQKAWKEIDDKLTDFWDFLLDFRLKSHLMPKSVSVSDSSILSATATPYSNSTSFKVKVNSLASSTVFTPNDTVGDIPAATTTVLSLNNRVVPVGGTYTIKSVDSNGNVLETISLNIDASTTIQDVVDQINASTTLSATYTSEGKLRIQDKTGGTVADLILGTSSDTSNFDEIFNLVGAKFEGGQIESTAHLGAISTSKKISDIFSSVSSGVIRINGVEITVDTDDTFAQLITRINNSDAGVVAWYDENEDKIKLRSKDTGPRDIVIEDGDLSGGNITGLVSELSWDNGSYDVGGTAQIEIDLDKDGVADKVLTSWTNSIEYEGITLNLSKTSTDWVDVTVSQDVDTTVERIQEFVDKYNEIISFIYEKLYEENEVENPETEEDKMKGVLKGDTNLERIFYALRDIVYGQVSWEDTEPYYKSLAEIGISSGDTGGVYQNTMKGLLSIDEDRLKEAIQNHAEDIWKLFAGESDTDGVQGIATRLKEYVWDTTKFGGTIDQISGVNGTIGTEMRDIALRMQDMLEILQMKEAMYWQKFSAMEQALAVLQQQSAYVMNALAARK